MPDVSCHFIICVQHVKCRGKLRETIYNALAICEIQTVNAVIKRFFTQQKSPSVQRSHVVAYYDACRKYSGV